MNDGFSHHAKPKQEHEGFVKPDPNLFYGLTIGFVSVILAIGITLVVFL